MPSSKSEYPAYDKARTSFNRHLRARRDIIQARYDQRFEAMKSEQRFRGANAAFLLSSELKMSKVGNPDGTNGMNEFHDANNGIICSGNMTDAWKAAKVEVVIGIDSSGGQFGKARILADLEDRPRNDVFFDVRGDPVKDDAIMFGEDVDDHMRHGLARVVLGSSFQAMRLGPDAPDRWRVPEEHLHPKVGYLWAVLHHPLHAYQIHTAVATLHNSHRRGSPGNLLGLNATELLTPATTALNTRMNEEHYDLMIRDSAMLHVEQGDEDVNWKSNTSFFYFKRGKVNRGVMSRSCSQIEVSMEIPETAMAAAPGQRLGALLSFPSCGDARTDEEVAAMTIRQVRRGDAGCYVITLEPVAHIPLVSPPAGIATVVPSFAPTS